MRCTKSGGGVVANLKSHSSEQVMHKIMLAKDFLQKIQLYMRLVKSTTGRSTDAGTDADATNIDFDDAIFVTDFYLIILL